MLSMAMVADGVKVDPFTLLKIKVQFIRLMGYADLVVRPTLDPNTLHIQYGEVTDVPEIAYPAIEGLRPLIDAAYTIDMPALTWGGYHEQEERTISVLVGFIFIDLVLTLISTYENLESLPVSPLKALLEAVYVVIHKVNLEMQPGRSLQNLLRQAIERIVQLAPKNVNYEIRQLALTVVQAFCKTCSTIIRVGETIL